MNLETLTKRFEQQTKEREETEAREKKLRERQKEIDDAPEWQVTDFYCHRIAKMFSCKSYKIIQSDWTAKGQRIAFYSALKPPCGCSSGYHRRYITDKRTDPFFKNPILEKQRKRQASDMLQPGMEGFNAKYGNPYKRFYDDMEKAERAKWTKKITTQTT